MRILFFLLLLTGWAAAVPPWTASAVQQAVEEGRWKEGQGLYEELKQKGNLTPDQQARLDYNIGVTLYKQEQYEKALPFFDSALKTGNDVLKARSHYNKGNSLFRMDKLKEAKQAFQQALLTNPDDDDARRNIEVILEKEKQQQNQQNKDQQDQDKEQQDQKDQDQKDDQNKDQNKDQNDEKNKDQDKGKNDKQKQNQDKDQQSEEEKKQQSKPEMSEAEKKAAQEARERARLLDYFEQKEKEGRPPIRMQPQAAPVRGKTW